MFIDFQGFNFQPILGMHQVLPLLLDMFTLDQQSSKLHLFDVHPDVKKPLSTGRLWETLNKERRWMLLEQLTNCKLKFMKLKYPFMSGIICWFNLADTSLDLSVLDRLLSEYHLSELFAELLNVNKMQIHLSKGYFRHQGWHLRGLHERAPSCYIMPDHYPHELWMIQLIINLQSIEIEIWLNGCFCKSWENRELNHRMYDAVI